MEIAPDPALHEALTAHVAQWVDLFNKGEVSALDRLYEDVGVLVPVPGHPVVGPERSAVNARLLSFGVPLEARLRRCYTADDIALLVIDWSLKGTDPDGNEISMAGTATDVVRRGADGIWRYVIDNPSGIE
ncbi:YybH family protein [Streptomyces muensis]|uniref:DUF4440 domain-containing protein n=1 Tax=Streptomyces muensis TaxID=1077944 RepID=A0A9X1PTI5_STRM4|nr:nuclear transport factor 2 family protein [Streptomyces muensis]MCF1592279.1 DUF4440 domain-containing protein [Streptomyces muensis]